MRVLFIDHTAEMGGGEFALLYLVQQLDRTKYEPVVMLLSHGPLLEKLQDSAVETYVMPGRESLVNARKDKLSAGVFSRLGDVTAMLSLVWRLRRSIRRLRIDLVHTNSLKADIIGGLAGRLARKWVIWHVHDRIADDYLPAKVARLFRCLSRILPHQVICNSNATLQTLTSGSPRYHVVHCGTNLPAEIASYPSGESPIIGIVGRLSPWKGQDVFLAAAAIVRKQFPSARFQIIGGALFGEQDFERQLHASAAKAQLSDIVEFTGFRSDVPQLMSRLDILVHASTTPEPFGQVVIEAMAAGKPVIATNGGGIPEIVVDGVTGLLVPMKDATAIATAIEKLLHDPNTAAEMGRRGRQRVVERFTTGHTAAKVQDIYNHLLGMPDAPPAAENPVLTPVSLHGASAT